MLFEIIGLTIPAGLLALTIYLPLLPKMVQESSIELFPRLIIPQTPEDPEFFITDFESLYV